LPPCTGPIDRARCPYLARTLLTYFFPTLLTPTLVVALLAFFPKAKPTRPARSSPSPTPLQASASRSVVVPAARSGVDRGRSQEEDGEPGVREEGGRVGRQGGHRTPLPLHLHPQVRRAAAVSRSLVFILSSSPLHICRTVSVPCANTKMDPGGRVTVAFDLRLQ